MEYNFSQHITKEDYIAFLMNHMKMNILKPFNIVIFIFGFGYLIAAPLIMGTGEYTFTYIGLGLLAFMILSIFFARYNAGRRYSKNPDMFDMEYRVTEEGFAFVIEQQESVRKWIDFYAATETKEYLYLFISKDNGTVLVKRDIPTDAVNFIRNQIIAHVNPKRVRVFREEE